MQNSRHAVNFLLVDFGVGLHVDVDMLHGLRRICCVVTRGKQSQLLTVTMLASSICQEIAFPTKSFMILSFKL